MDEGSTHTHAHSLQHIHAEGLCDQSTAQVGAAILEQQKVFLPLLHLVPAEKLKR